MEENLDDKKISEDGTLEVQVSVVGDIVGSDHEGNPIQQHIDAESLQKIADDLNESGKPCLCDVDHQSSKQGLDRNTRAAGWLKTWWTNVKGLFAKLHLTPYGRQLVEGKEYTQLSPVFVLDKSGRPTSLVAASLTNTAAMQDIDTLLNQKPEEAIIMEMTKEELVNLIKETVTTMNQAHMEEAKAEPEDKPAEEQQEEKQEEKPAEETAENACGKETSSEEATNGSTEPEASSEEKIDVDEMLEEKPKEDKKPEEKKPEEKKPEVISEAALNMAATSPSQKVDWHGLHGNEFFAWLAQNKQSI